MSPLSIVLTIAVLVLIFILFKYFVSDPNTLSNVASGQTLATIEASSLATNGSTAASGNFAYSVWFYVNDWNYRYGEPKVIFGRMGAPSGSGTGSVQGVNGVDPCPVVVLGATQNNLSVSLGCYPGANQEPTTPGGRSIVHTCTLANIPIQRWVNLVVSVFGRTMDLYIDGKLVRTCLLPGVASVNPNANIYVTPAGGFDGWTSKLQYYPGPLNPQEVYNIYTQGYQNWLTGLFGSYQVQVSVIENGTTTNSVTF